MIIIIKIIIIVIINLIYITQFNTSILTVLYIVIAYTQMQYVHI